MKTHSPWAWVPSLYFAEGLPYVAVMIISLVMYKRMGISNTENIQHRDCTIHKLAKPAMGYKASLESVYRPYQDQAVLDNLDAAFDWCRTCRHSVHYSHKQFSTDDTRDILAHGIQFCHSRHCRRRFLHARALTT